MDTTDRAPDHTSEAQSSQAPRHRWLWFVAIWAASVLALTVVSQLIRWAIMP